MGNVTIDASAGVDGGMGIGILALLLDICYLTLRMDALQDTVQYSIQTRMEKCGADCQYISV